MDTKYYILHAKNFFSKNVCLRTKFDLPLKKKQKKFWAKFSKLLEKFFVSPSKKCQSYNFHIWDLYDKHFFQKRKPQFFFITRLFYLNQTATEISLYQFSTIFRKCMKIV